MKEQEKYDLFKSEKSVITSDDILGKDVIDIEGNSIGIVTIMHIDKKTKSIVGVSVDTGFMKPQVFVGIDLIKNFGIDAVYISKTPSSRYIGMSVYDIYGNYVGKVDHLEFSEKSQTVQRVVVSIGMMRSVVLITRHLKNIGRGIILKIPKEEVFEIYKKQKSKGKKGKDQPDDDPFEKEEDP